MKILNVIDRSSPEPIIYANKIDVDLKVEVRAAADQCAIEMTDEDVTTIVAGLANDMYSNFGNFCFDVVEAD